MSSKPKVSVIITTYNSEKVIGSTIDSVLNQTLTDYELIIIDDKSTDNTVTILKDYVSQNPQKIKYFQMEENTGGPAKPRNTGIGKARGIYICFLDADDLWHQRKLEVQLALLQDLKMSFCCTNRIFFREEAEIKGTEKAHEQFYRLGFYDLAKGNKVSLSSVMIETKLVERYLFREDKGLVAVEDYELWLRVLKNEEIYVLFLKYPFLFYRVSTESLSANKFKQATKIYHVLKCHLALIQRELFFLFYLGSVLMKKLIGQR